MKYSDQPLKAEIKDGLLSISIGVDILAFAIENADKCDLYNFKITNPKGFGEDVLHELEAENEVGETLVSDLLDKAAIRAIEQGSENVEEITPEERQERMK